MLGWMSNHCRISDDLLITSSMQVRSVLADWVGELRMFSTRDWTLMEFVKTWRYWYSM